MNVLDLFSGIGGFSLGLERAGMRTVAFCEIDAYCRAVLRKHWPDVPIHGDIRELRPEHLAEPIDLICGGYPCQPFSVAGKRAGEADDRHLWPEYRRLVEALRPAWVVGENVAGHVSMGLDSVLSDLDALGYSYRPFVIPACAIGARHRRDRVWVVAHRDAGQRLESLGQVQAGRTASGSRGEDVADSEGERRRRGLCQAGTLENGPVVADGSSSLADAERQRGRGRHAEREDAEDAGQSPRHPQSRSWDAEPNVGRVAHGVPARMDRLRALGNAVVPQIPEIIGRAIMRSEHG